MSAHALLSPSSAHRWLNCPLAPRLEAQLPEKPSEYAREGTIAHSICEVSAKLHFKKIKKTEYNKVVKKLWRVPRRQLVPVLPSQWHLQSAGRTADWSVRRFQRRG